MILAGDIGGTKTNLAYFDLKDGRLVSVAEATYPSRDHQSLDEIAGDFLSKRGLKAERACFGIAGPVHHGHSHTTNLPWAVDAERLASELAIPAVSVINDLEATAYGIAALAPSEVAVINAGAPDSEGNRAVIAAGTGLGEAGMYWDGRDHQPFACEGGHCDFSPNSARESRLAAYLLDRFGHAAWERVTSGPGLHNLYDFLALEEPGKANKDVADEIRTAADATPVISRAATEKRCPVCVEALDLFVRLYGAEAGNLALKIMSTGGLYIGGGIAPRIVSKLQEGPFLAAFVAKGRMKPLLEAMPVRVILNSKAALLGAARRAQMKY